MGRGHIMPHLTSGDLELYSNIVIFSSGHIVKIVHFGGVILYFLYKILNISNENTNEAWSKYGRIRNEYVPSLALSKEAYGN